MSHVTLRRQTRRLVGGSHQCNAFAGISEYRLNRFPILVWAGALLLGGIAGDLAGSDANLAFLHGYWPGYTDWDGPAGASLVAAAGSVRRWHGGAAKET